MRAVKQLSLFNLQFTIANQLDQSFFSIRLYRFTRTILCRIRTNQISKGNGLLRIQFEKPISAQILKPNVGRNKRRNIKSAYKVDINL